MIDKIPLYYVIHEGVVTEERCHRTDSASIDHFLYKGEVVRRMPRLDGSQQYEYRKLYRCSTRSPSGTCIGNPSSWSVPLYRHEMPPLLQLYLTLNQ